MSNISQRRRILKWLGVGVGAAVIGQFLNKIMQNTTALALNPGQSMPEFQGIEQWLNSPPLNKKLLTGKVTMIHFWTLGCINCQRTLPYVTRWYKDYAAKGFVVVGIHTPEFAYERDLDTLKKALAQYGITYPIATDNAFKTWNVYSNRYWPHLFIFDRAGKFQYHHIGEGAYERTEATIVKLLG